MQEGGWLEVLEPLIPTALLHEGPRGQHPLLKDPRVGTGAQGCDLPIVTLVEPTRVPRWVLASPARTADVLIHFITIGTDDKINSDHIYHFVVVNAKVPNHMVGGGGV